MSTRKKAVKKVRSKKKVTRRSRDYVLPKEVDSLLRAAINAGGRHAHRNYTLILLCYRHGLRLYELTELRWRMVDMERKILRVSRTRNGINSVQPLRAPELIALRKLKRLYPDSSYLSVNARGNNLPQRTVSTAVAATGRAARLRRHVSPSMWRRG